MSLPVIPSNLVIALSVDEMGPKTSPPPIGPLPSSPLEVSIITDARLPAGVTPAMPAIKAELCVPVVPILIAPLSKTTPAFEIAILSLSVVFQAVPVAYPMRTQSLLLFPFTPFDAEPIVVFLEPANVPVPASWPIPVLSSPVCMKFKHSNPRPVFLSPD